LIARYGADVPTHQTRTARDIDATRARVMHTLYVTAHALAVALNTHGKDLVRESRDQDRPIPLSSIHTAYAVPPTGAWIQRAARCKSLAHTYLAGRFVTAAHGEAARSADDQDRIPRALARWELQAHRTLAHDPSPANLDLITRSQALITAASITLSGAADNAASYVAGRDSDLSVDQLGWRPALGAIEGPALPGVAGVVQAQHNVVVDLTHFPSAQNLREVLAGQATLAHRAAMVARSVESPTATSFKVRATLYRRLLRESRTLGGELGSGRRAALESANAAHRMMNGPAMGRTSRRRLTSSCTWAIASTRVAAAVEHGFREKLYFTAIRLPVPGQAGSRRHRAIRGQVRPARPADPV
jgi:hypothetical protein